MSRTGTVFFLKIYLIAVLLCIAAVAGFGELPGVVYAVLFPMITLFAIIFADWWDKHVSIEVRYQR